MNTRRSPGDDSRAPSKLVDTTTLTIDDWSDLDVAARWVLEVGRPRWPGATTNDVVWVFSIVSWARGARG